MDKFVIEGGAPLHGSIPTSGSKNSALPALAAALLTEDKVVLNRVPRVRDIRTMERLLQDIGSEINVEEERVTLETPRIVSPEAPYELVKTMRASSLVLGRSSRVPAAPAFRYPAAAPSALAPSISTSPVSNFSARKSRRSTATLRPSRPMA